MKKRSWWRKDSAVTHNYYGHGVITNFVGCPAGAANVYFYKGEQVQEVWKRDCVCAGPYWTDENS